MHRDYGNDMVLIDTAGRLQIDEELMDELRRIKEAVQPHEILLVVDAMTGQEAVNVAKAFDDLLNITGVISDQAGRRYPRRRCAIGTCSYRQAD